jgi:hypothetical protein
MLGVLIEPRHHFSVPQGWIVLGITYPIELANMTAILGYGSN